LIGVYPRLLKPQMTNAPNPMPADDAPVLRETHAELAVAVLVLNRPKALNALSDTLMGALDDALDALEADDGIRCVVLRGAGRAFAAGADVSAMSEQGAAELLAGGQLARWARVRAFEKPLIAAVHGYALGGGCELAQACDIVIAADDARFGLPEVSLGIIPGAGGTQLTPRAIGKSLAMEMVLAGRTLTADEALAHGLCSRVVAREALQDEAIALASAIASRPALATKLAKRAIAQAYESSLREGAAYEHEAFMTAFASDDAREGIQAFVEKRAPRWQGR
jgi:enoyl-CoA hydratase